ncbi:glucose-1-phosphate cytidylyltransferase [Paracoccus sp. S1E-3]|nr:glucose-1-phosphate cytidylyltransferase [Paracoccus sp. S1E-3]
MVDVGGRPLMTRLMEVYAHFGHTDFIIAAGHQSVAIKQFFANYHLMANDVRVAIDTGQVELHPIQGAGWTVSIVDTGIYSTNSARLCLLRKWIGTEPFMLAYADSLANLDVQEMLEFHNSHGKLATIAAVRPPARAGNLELLDTRVTAFTRQVRRSDTWINGGFLILEPAVFDYLLDDHAALEAGPLAQLAQDGELMAYRHYGFWQPLDTVADRKLLAAHCTAEPPPWLRFEPRQLAQAPTRAAE